MKEGYKKTELGWIPKEWEVKKVGEIVKALKSGLSRNLKEQNVGIPCIRSNNIKNNRLVLDDLKYWFKIDDKGANIDDYMLEHGDIIINFINSISQIGKGCIFDKEGFDAIYTTNLLRIKVDENIISNKFFYHYTQTERYKKEINLITKPAVNQASFTTVEYKAIKFPIPPLKEQQKIADILSTVDSQIDDTDKLIEKTKELKKGLMQRLLTKGIGHSEFKKSEVGEIPVEWNIDKIGKCSEVTKLAGFEFTEYVNYVDDGEIIALRALNLKNGKLDLEDVKRINKEVSNNLQRSKLFKGNLLFSYVGTIGEVALVDENDKYHLGPNVAKITFTKDILSNYAIQYMRSEIIKKEIKKYVTTTSQPALSMENIREMKIVIPPLKEQKQIANILSSVDTQIQEYENKKAKLEQLKKGLMQKLLTGKIRVV